MCADLSASFKSRRNPQWIILVSLDYFSIMLPIYYWFHTKNMVILLGNRVLL